LTVAERLSQLTYPDATAIDHSYGTGSGNEDMMGVVKQVKNGATVLTDYSHLGVDRTVIADYTTQPGVQLTYYASSGTTDAGDQYVGLDRFGRVIDQRWHKAGTDKERVKYGFDRASNRQWRQNTVAGTGQDEFYTYDGLYQVKTLDRGTLTGTPPTGISGTPSWEEDWNYDPTGNWRGGSSAYLTKVSGTTTLNQNRTHNVANELTAISTTTGTAWPNPTLDANGNMTKVPKPLDLGNSYDLKYDAWNRLVEVKPTGGSVLATYRYDGAFRRVTALISSNTRHYYYSDQWQVVEERLNALTTADKRFVWGKRYTDDLILRDNGATRHYVLHDYYNVTAIVDTSGTVLERYGYDAFGTVRYMNASFGSASSSYSWETLYGAYRYDSDTGLYQVRFRYHHPKLGRWINRDPIGEVAGTNLYAYVGNNGPNSVDWLGLTDCTALKAAIARVKESIHSALRSMSDINQMFDSAQTSAGISLCISALFAAQTATGLGKALSANASETAPVLTGATKGTLPVGVFTSSGTVGVAGSFEFKATMYAANAADAARNTGAALIGAKEAGSTVAQEGAQDVSETVQRVLDPYGRLADVQNDLGASMSAQTYQTIQDLQGLLRGMMDEYRRNCSN